MSPILILWSLIYILTVVAVQAGSLSHMLELILGLTFGGVVVALILLMTLIIFFLWCRARTKKNKMNGYNIYSYVYPSLVFVLKTSMCTF